MAHLKTLTLALFQLFLVIYASSSSEATKRAALADDLPLMDEGISLLQGHATKIIKKRSAAAGSAGAARSAGARAAVALDDDLDMDMGGIALIQEKQAKIRKGASRNCEQPAYEPPRGSIDAALMAAAADGVEDGLAAL
mmetsp:Transcript_54203/g.115705  ORF Transcript_54203/g.115705 Transcript_54203/m.115705 type:complete len:139 (-) Transcript_54203:126-542(-)|eukprot:CAMPEP_0194781714 /NCGR_PEP_ID=MMETSP0323_2-20130528/77064_1 /TAXON_ID=2866 ORGANISM="Crypthecodinium cohnii, Strain Seligo" /NCGR_SAMPLE_ID=MMETSP0323_2 /ASSEMBLY_ACC=CAM_ASM_000346 /LENGTH=138 /DNA_ID=CAMNT_0039720267 /DNA_START=46 /DNA_END=462 /DNA_ORIENTATION=+